MPSLPSAKEKRSEAATTNGIEAWVFALDGDYAEGPTVRASVLEGYDIVIANTNHPLDHLPINGRFVQTDVTGNTAHGISQD